MVSSRQSPARLCRALLVFVCLVFGVTSEAFTQTPPQAPAPQTVRPVRSAIVNFRDLAEQQRLSPAARRPPSPKAIHRPQPAPELEGPVAERSAALAPDVFQSFVPSPAPALGFQAQSDPDFSIPPDTHGAVGLSHVFSVHNTDYVIQNKATGAVVSQLSMNTFWSVLGHSVFDPRVVYDPYNDRWYHTAAADGPAATSATVFAISLTSDPAGSYSLFEIDADPSDLNWADFPTLGFNKNWIAVTVNLFSISAGAFQGSEIYMFDAAAARDGTLSSITVAANGNATIQPAVTYSNTENALYLVSHLSSASALYRFFSITGTPAAPVFAQIGGNLTNSLGGWVQPVGEILPQGPSGVRSIDSGDARIGNVVFRNNAVYYAQTIGLPAGGTITRTAAQWVQLATTGAFVQGGRVDDGTGTFWYAYPSISVNANGDALLGFSRFSSNTFASTGYAFRYSGDPANSMRDPVVSKAGLGLYWKQYTGPDNRWGDYSMTTVDPSDDVSLWTIQEFAAAPVGTGVDSGRFGTWWAKVVPQIPTVTSITANRAFPAAPGTTITWTANAAGGLAPLQYQFYRFNSNTSTWTLVQPYSLGNTYTWTPTSGEQGTYQLQAWVRNAGSTASYDAYLATPFFSISTSSPPAVVSLTANQTFPLAAGTPMTWTAIASGGSAVLQYQFWLYDMTLGTWSIAQAYSTSSTFTWTPSDAQAGPYVVQVWVRSTGSTASLEASATSSPFAITSATLTVSAVTITGATQTASPMTFTARARGGVEPAQFRFFIYNVGTSTFTLLQDWSTARSAAWTFTSTGTFRVQAHGRNAGSTGGADGYADSVDFTVTAAPINAVITADRGFPAATGTIITWTAAATGGNGPLQYKFWRYKVATSQWTMVQDYSASTSYAWTPGPTDQGSYLVQAWVRSSGSAETVDGYASSGYFGIDNTSPVGGVVIEATPALPHRDGKTVTWRGKATGGDVPLEYRWWINAGGGWSSQPYSISAPSFPFLAFSGDSYVLQLWVRRVGFAGSYEAFASTGNVVVQPDVPPATTLTGNFTGSVPAGTELSVRASTTPTTTAYEYKFYRYSSSAGAWTMVQDWSASDSYGQALPSSPGNYIIQVWTRIAGSGATSALTFANFSYTITP